MTGTAVAFVQGQTSERTPQQGLSNAAESAERERSDRPQPTSATTSPGGKAMMCALCGRWVGTQHECRPSTTETTPTQSKIIVPRIRALSLGGGNVRIA